MNHKEKMKIMRWISEVECDMSTIQDNLSTFLGKRMNWFDCLSWFSDQKSLSCKKKGMPNVN